MAEAANGIAKLGRPDTEQIARRGVHINQRRQKQQSPANWVLLFIQRTFAALNTK